MAKDMKKISKALMYELRRGLDKYGNIDNNGMVPLRDVIQTNPSLVKLGVKLGKKVGYETVLESMTTSRNEDGYGFEYFRNAEGEFWVRAAYSKSSKERHEEMNNPGPQKRRRLSAPSAKKIVIGAALRATQVCQEDEYGLTEEYEEVDLTQEYDAAADIGDSEPNT